MIVAITLILLLTFISILIHLEGLWAIRRNSAFLLTWPRLGLSTIVLLSIILHVIEIGCFAAAYYVAGHFPAMGHLLGRKVPSLADCLYFSAETFTALGYGDVTSTGDLRIIAVSEPLVGLTLISWSGAYTFLAMQEFWQGKQAVRQARD